MVGFNLENQIFRSGKFTSLNFQFSFFFLLSFWNSTSQILDLLDFLISSTFFSYFGMNFLEISLSLSFDPNTDPFVPPDINMLIFQVYCFSVVTFSKHSGLVL